MRPNHSAYFASISAELEVQADRVRSLIGSKHWLSDGGHKESLLRGVLARHMPAGVLLSRGFLIDSFSSGQCSREQDILVLNNSSDAPLFNYGGLAITSHEQAYGCISVKSRFARRELVDAVEGFCSVPSSGPKGMFFGSFHFGEMDQEMSLTDLGDRIVAWLSPLPHLVSVIIRASSSLLVVLDVERSPKTVRLYQAKPGAAAFFVARLVNHIAVARTQSPSAFADALDSADGEMEVCEKSLPRTR